VVLAALGPEAQAAGLPLVAPLSRLTSVAAAAPGLVGSLVDALLDLALPNVCAACGQPPGPLCPSCDADLPQGLFDRPLRAMPDPVPPHLPSVVAAGPCDGVLRRLVSAYKDDERRDSAPARGAAGAPAARGFGGPGQPRRTRAVVAGGGAPPWRRAGC